MEIKVLSKIWQKQFVPRSDRLTLLGNLETKLAKGWKRKKRLEERNEGEKVGLFRGLT